MTEAEKRMQRVCFTGRHTARVIAVFNGEKGGTKNTIDYAARVGVPTVRIGGKCRVFS